MEPRHLLPLTRRLEAAARGEPQRVVCAAPPRHAKTETLLHFPGFALARRPELTISYSTYGSRLARSGSIKARGIAERVGVSLASNTINEWRTTDGGGFLAGGVGGPLTGYGVNVAIIDDPIKNRLEAESATYRSRLEDWYNDVLYTRVEPGGSIFLFMTRWTEDDLAAFLVKQGFESIHFPAITTADDGAEVPLWPERWPIEELQAKRAGTHAYTWESLYQGNPRPRGSRVFNDATTYAAPLASYRTAFGADLSYTAKTKSDWSVAVKMRVSGDVFHVVDVQRVQASAPDVKRRWAALHASEPRARWRWYAAGTEIGSADFFREEPNAVPVVAMAPRGDKFTRALAYAAAWNAGRVQVPQSALWLDDFLAEHASFTGSGDRHDDIIDAAVAAFDELDASPSFGLSAEPKRSDRPSAFDAIGL